MRKDTEFEAYLRSSLDEIKAPYEWYTESELKRNISYSVHGTELDWPFNQKTTKELSARTESAYKAATDHFQFVCGLFLPATPGEVIKYLQMCSKHYAPDTLKIRLSALSHWHKKMGFVDPTEHGLVRSAIFQISLISSYKPKRTMSFTIDHLITVDNHLKAQLHGLSAMEHRGKFLRTLRDRAMFLLGFWRALGTTELGLISSHDILVDPVKGLNLASLDRARNKTARCMPWRETLCVATSVEELLRHTLPDGALFQKIEQNGKLTGTPLSEKSIIPILQDRVNETGLMVKIGAHSFRRGFSEWARDSNWSISSMLDYIGWNGLNRHLNHLDKKNN